jgi:hypothetical protein
MSRSLVHVYRRFGVTSCLHLQNLGKCPPGDSDLHYDPLENHVSHIVRFMFSLLFSARAYCSVADISEVNAASIIKVEVRTSNESRDY